MSGFSRKAYEMLRAFEASAACLDLKRVPSVLKTRGFGAVHFEQVRSARNQQQEAIKFKLAEQEMSVSGGIKNQMKASCLFYMEPMPEYGQESYTVVSDQLLMRENKFIRLVRPLPIIYANLDRLQDRVMSRGAPALDYRSSDFERIQMISLLLAQRMGPLVAASPTGYAPAFIPISSGVLVATAHLADQDHYGFRQGSVVATREPLKARVSLDLNPAALMIPQAEIVVRGFYPMVEIPQNDPLRPISRDLISLVDGAQHEGASIRSVVDYIMGEYSDPLGCMLVGGHNTMPCKKEGQVWMGSDLGGRDKLISEVDRVVTGYQWDIASEMAKKANDKNIIRHRGVLYPPFQTTQPLSAAEHGVSHKEDPVFSISV